MRAMTWHLLWHATMDSSIGSSTICSASMNSDTLLSGIFPTSNSVTAKLFTVCPRFPSISDAGRLQSYTAASRFADGSPSPPTAYSTFCASPNRKNSDSTFKISVTSTASIFESWSTVVWSSIEMNDL